MPLDCGADGFESDVVEPAQFVAAGGIAFCGLAVPGQPFLELGNKVEKGLGGGQIAGVLQEIGLGTNELVGLGEVGASAIADDLFGDGGGQRVAGEAGEGVGAAALEGRC